MNNRSLTKGEWIFGSGSKFQRILKIAFLHGLFTLPTLLLLLPVLQFEPSIPPDTTHINDPEYAILLQYLIFCGLSAALEIGTETPKNQ